MKVGILAGSIVNFETQEVYNLRDFEVIEIEFGDSTEQFNGFEIE
jgi:hypothetical protein